MHGLLSLSLESFGKSRLSQDLGHSSVEECLPAYIYMALSFIPSIANNKAHQVIRMHFGLGMHPGDTFLTGPLIITKQIKPSQDLEGPA